MSGAHHIPSEIGSLAPAAQQCGWLKERVGLSWQVAPMELEEVLKDPDHEQSDRVLQSMLQMKKLDVPALRAAFQGKAVVTGGVYAGTQMATHCRARGGRIAVGRGDQGA